jgi:hypothetical protein
MFRSLRGIPGISIFDTVLITELADELRTRMSDEYLRRHIADGAATGALRGPHSTGLLAGLGTSSARQLFNDALQLSAVVAAITVPSLVFLRSRPSNRGSHRSATTE